MAYKTTLEDMERVIKVTPNPKQVHKLEIVKVFNGEGFIRIPSEQLDEEQAVLFCMGLVVNGNRALVKKPGWLLCLRQSARIGEDIACFLAPRMILCSGEVGAFTRENRI